MGELLAQLNISGVQINDAIPADHRDQFSNLGTTIASFINVFVYIAAFLMVVWAFWGVFKYIFAEGNKDALAKARSQITWSIIGFILLLISYAAAQVIQHIFGARDVPVRGLNSGLFQLIPVAHAEDLGPQFPLSFPSMADLLSRIVGPMILIAGLAILGYLLYGGFKYLSSGGNKDTIAQARGMMVHAIIGFVLLLFLFLIIQFVLSYFGVGFQVIK